MENVLIIDLKVCVWTSTINLRARSAVGYFVLNSENANIP